MKSIVTGGAGFIGSNLVDKLVSLGHKVTVIDNLKTARLSNLKKSKRKIKFIKADITKGNLDNYFKNHDYVFHLAGLADIVPSIKNPYFYFDANVNGTIKVLEYAKKNKVKKFIYAASASCYGIPKKYPTKEGSLTDPQYPYALSKFLGEQIVMHWAKIYEMVNISLRFFNVYGPRSRTSGAYGAVFGVFLAQKLANKPLTIVGNGKQTRDFIHIDDLTDAIIKVIKVCKKSDIFNLGSGKEHSVNYIANIISNYQTNIPKRPGEPERSLADISKIKRLTKWTPKIKLKHGVSTLLKDIKKWKDAPVWTPSSIKSETREWFSLLK